MFLKLSKLSSTGVLEEGGGATGFQFIVAKQAVEFPQVVTSTYYTGGEEAPLDWGVES